MLRNPPDVLITTPESLYLMLTSRAREFLVDAEAVIVDEIHAVARTKRGAHLALTLERLEHLAGRPLQRIGLSATQRPLEEVGRFLVGAGRECEIVDAGMRKPLDLKIHVPVENMREPDAHDVSDPASTPWARRRRRRPSARPARPPAALDLAGDLPRAARAGPGAPLHDHLREQPPRRRAAGGAAQRAGAARRTASPHAIARGAPRLARPRGAAGGGGPPEVGRAALPRGHLVARARHRHGRGGPRDPGRVAEVGHRRAPAHRPRRPRRGRGVARAHLPQVPRRPARVRGRGQAHARRRHRADRGAAQPARRAGPAGRGDGGGRATTGACRELHDAGPPRLPLRRALARAARQRARHARRPLPERGVRRAAAADRLGPRGGHDPGPHAARASWR